MSKLIIDHLSDTAARYGDKVAFEGSERSATFSEIEAESRQIATGIIRNGVFKKPIAIFMDKEVACIIAMLGVVTSGCFYTILDTKMPAARIEKILSTLQPEAVLTTDRHREEVSAFYPNGSILIYEDLVKTEADTLLLAKTRARIIDTDVLYVLFTSGSTGVPKGVVISHRAVNEYLDWGAEEFGLNSDTVFANQTPFYFVMSGFDIFQTIRNGCTMHIVPKELFAFPYSLLTFLKEKHVNTIFWVPSALCLIANFRILPELHLDELKTVMFGGEVMPSKQLNMWRKEYPDVIFVNQYGPTELTDICTFYVVDREIDDSEMLPIGKACSHMDIIILNENDQPVEVGEVGELCGRGSSLAYGYYNDPVKTAEVFVQNPLQTAYEEKIYRTGDLVRINELGEIVYVCRKDFQIKHMGNRIELGEIEVAVSAVEGIDNCCCLYDTEKKQIVLIYTGPIEPAELGSQLKSKLPDYMLPNRREKQDSMPFNLNGKIDRAKLKEMFIKK